MALSANACAALGRFLFAKGGKKNLAREGLFSYTFYCLHFKGELTLFEFTWETSFAQEYSRELKFENIVDPLGNMR